MVTAPPAASSLAPETKSAWVWVSIAWVSFKPRWLASVVYDVDVPPGIDDDRLAGSIAADEEGGLSEAFVGKPLKHEVNVPAASAADPARLCVTILRGCDRRLLES